MLSSIEVCNKRPFSVFVAFVLFAKYSDSRQYYLELLSAKCHKRGESECKRDGTVCGARGRCEPSTATRESPVRGALAALICPNHRI
jgi:hypothetical protein